MRKQADQPSARSRKDQLGRDLPSSTENHFPPRAARFRPVIRQLSTQEESSAVEEEPPFGELNLCLAPPEAGVVKALLVGKRKSNSQGMLKGLFLVKYDSLKRLFFFHFLSQ